MQSSQHKAKNSLRNLAQNSKQGLKQTPLVSIIVPIYNVASYLKECLQSIVAQSYENLDIILIDDGSDDESLKIALNFAENDKRIFVISKPNGGLSSARNFGLEFIKGSALRTFFDDGDISPTAQNDNNQLCHTDKSCHNETFSCHTERSEVSQTQNRDISLSTKAQNDKEKAFQTNTSIQSLSQTHSFEKSYKSIDTQELRAHFTQIKHNFIKSDLERINDFITQELPQNALIHFVDSDDYITQDCVAKCVQALLEKDLDIVVHNNKEFDDNTKKITILKRLSQFQSLKQDEYNSGLELLAQNQIYDFYFAWQGLFKASILNRYALRFTEGIYHEDHDFGTLLFCLAGKISYTNEPLYIYRQRANSIITAQKNTAFPSKMPSFLEPLRADFKDYKALRAYFKSFCLIVVSFKCYEFYTSKKIKGVKAFLKKMTTKCVSEFVLQYRDTNCFYTQNANKMLDSMGFKNKNFWFFYFTLRVYVRNPRKILQLFGIGHKNKTNS